jgi:hypothetical protein
MSPDRAAEAVLQRLKEGGPTAFDITREADRSHAVDATIRAGLDLLPAAAADRFLELGIFAADRPIDLNALGRHPSSAHRLLTHATATETIR